MTTLRKNLALLKEREAEYKALKAEHAEARAGGSRAAASEVASRLEAARHAHDSRLGIVEQQKTIKGLWVPATPAYKRAEAQVAALTSQMEMLGE